VNGSHGTRAIRSLWRRPRRPRHCSASRAWLLLVLDGRGAPRLLRAEVLGQARRRHISRRGRRPSVAAVPPTERHGRIHTSTITVAVRVIRIRIAARCVFVVVVSSPQLGGPQGVSENLRFEVERLISDARRDFSGTRSPRLGSGGSSWGLPSCPLSNGASPFLGSRRSSSRWNHRVIRRCASRCTNTAANRTRAAR